MNILYDTHLALTWPQCSLRTAVIDLMHFLYLLYYCVKSGINACYMIAFCLCNNLVWTAEIPPPVVPCILILSKSFYFTNECTIYRVAREMSYIFSGLQRRPENLAQLRAHIVKLCRALSEDLHRKVVTGARVRVQEVVRQNGGHIEHVLH